MLSTLAKGSGTWAGELEVTENGKKHKFPVVADPDHPHKHGVTVSPRKHGAGVTATGPPSPPRQELHSDGQIALPKTYLTRKGALFLFTVPNGVTLGNPRLGQDGRNTVKGWEPGAKIRTLERFAKSVLQYGDDDYGAHKAASLSECDDHIFLKFLHSLNNTPVDIHSQPGADFNFYLEEYKSRWASAKITQSLPSGPPQTEDNVNETRSKSLNSLNETDQSESGRSVSSAGQTRGGGGDAELITADTGKLVDQFTRPGSHASVQGDRPPSSASMRPVLSAAKLAASLKSVSYMGRPDSATSSHRSGYSVARPSTCFPQSMMGSRPGSGFSRYSRSRPASAARSRPGSGLRSPLIRAMSRPPSGSMSRPNSVASQHLELPGQDRVSISDKDEAQTEVDENISLWQESDRWTELIDREEVGTETDIESVYPDRHVSEVHVHSRPLSPRSVVSHQTLHDQALLHAETFSQSTFHTLHDAQSLRSHTEPHLHDGMTETASVWDDDYGVDPDLYQEEDLPLPHDEAYLQPDLLPNPNTECIYEYSGVPLAKPFSRPGSASHSLSTGYHTMVTVETEAASGTHPSQPQYTGGSFIGGASSVFSLDTTVTESANLEHDDSTTKAVPAETVTGAVNSRRSPSAKSHITSSSSIREEGNGGEAVKPGDFALDTKKQEPQKPQAPSPTKSPAPLMKITSGPKPPSSPLTKSTSNATQKIKATSAKLEKKIKTPRVSSAASRKRDVKISTSTETSNEQVSQPSATTNREFKEFTSESLISDTRAEIERVFGKQTPVKTKKASGGTKGNEGSIKKHRSKEKEKEKEKEKDLEVEIPEEVKQLMEGGADEFTGEEGGLTVEELELQQQLLKEKMESAQEQLKSAGIKSTKPGKPANKEKKEKKSLKVKDEKDEEMERKKQELREARRLEKEKREQEAKQLQDLIKQKEEDRKNKEMEAKREQERKEAELKRIAEEEESIRQQEEEVKRILAEQRRIEREEREARRKLELERKKQEAIRQREKQKEMMAKARQKELEMLERIADSEARRRRREELEEDEEEENEKLEMEFEESLKQVEFEMEQEEAKIAYLEKKAEEEAMADMVREREEAECRRQKIEEEMEKVRQQEQEKMQKMFEEQQKLELEIQKREEEEEKQREIERQRLLELRKMEEEAREKMRQEMQNRREELLKLREKNIERKNNLESVRRSQGVTKPWVFSYYVLWPRETYEKPMISDDKKKGGKKSGKKGKKSGKKSGKKKK